MTLSLSRHPVTQVVKTIAAERQLVNPLDPTQASDAKAAKVATEQLIGSLNKFQDVRQ